MTTYRWTGTDERGDAAGGDLEAAGLLAAADALRAKGMSVTALERSGEWPEAKRLSDLDAFTFFNESLAKLCALGMPLPRAVAEIAKGLKRGRFRAALERMEARLREGKSLQAASAELGGDFRPAYRCMIQAGAKSGDLPGVLGAVTRSAEGFRRVRRALVSSLAYPAAVLGFSLLFLSVFAGFFVAIFEDMHRQFDFEPPAVFRGLIAAFRSPLAFSATLAVGLAAAAAVAAWLARTPSGEQALLRVPWVGPIRKNLLLARFADALGTLLRARTPLADALPVACGASGSRSLEEAAPALAKKAAEGAGLEEVLRDVPLVPPAMRSYLAIGERGGRAPDAAREVASLLSEQAAAASETLYLILLPLAILVAGLLLGGFLVSSVIPYYDFLTRIRP
jgi:type IV pilus assembly protein PilC